MFLVASLLLERAPIATTPAQRILDREIGWVR